MLNYLLLPEANLFVIIDAFNGKWLIASVTYFSPEPIRGLWSQLWPGQIPWKCDIQFIICSVDIAVSI